MNLSDLLPMLEGELEGLAFGEVVLRVQVRDGRPYRAEVSRSRSIMLPTETICAGPVTLTKDSAASAGGMRGGMR